MWINDNAGGWARSMTELGHVGIRLKANYIRLLIRLWFFDLLHICS